MQIPPNILRELEEKKAKAVLAEATAVEEKTPFILPPLPPSTPLLEETGETPTQGSGQVGEMGENGKPSGGELFFGYLAKAAVFLAVFLTPMFFFTSSDTVNLPKQMLLSVLAMVALGAWVGQTVASGRLTWRKTVLAWPVLLVGLAAVLSSAFSSSFWVSFLGDSGRYAFSGVSVLSYLIIFLSAVQLFDRRDSHIAVALWLGSTFLVSVHALLQFFGIYVIPGDAYQSRIFNTVGSSFSLGLFALSTVPFILAFLSKAKPWKIQGLALVVMLVVQLAAAAIVDFRVGWLALAASAVVLILAGFKKQTGSIGPGYQQKILLPLGIIVLATLLWLVRAPQIKDLVFPAEVNPSYGASLDILVQTLKEKPAFGSGLETYPYVYARFKDASLNQTNYWGVNFNNAAAEVITWATTTGIFGALAWLAFVILFLKMGLIGEKGEREWKTGLFASWIFILIAKFFYATSLPLEFMFWFLPALMIKGTRGEETGERRWQYGFQTGSVKTLVVFSVMLAVLLGALAGGYFSVRRAGAERTFVKAILTPMTSSESGQVEPEKRNEMINGVYAAVAANPYESRYFRVLAQALFAKMNDVVAGINARTAGERQARQEETALLQNLTAQTINAVQRAGALDPDNVGVAVDAGESHRNLAPLVQGADDLAIQNYERASALEPINPFIKTQLGQLYLIKSNMFNQGLDVDVEYSDKARAVLDAALKLNPNYANARYFYALIQDYDGLKQEALQNFLILRQTNPDNQLIAQIVQNMQNSLPALGIPPRPATPPQSPKAVETKGVPK